MRQSITQEFDYGCGIACFAFVLEMTYQQQGRNDCSNQKIETIPGWPLLDSTQGLLDGSLDKLTN